MSFSADLIYILTGYNYYVKLLCIILGYLIILPYHLPYL